MKKLILLTVACYFFTFNLNAKAKFLPGIIITTEQDTLKGLINCSDYTKLHKECIFKTNSKAKTSKYIPYTLKSFQIISSQREFVSAINPTNGKPVFMEVVRNGNIRLLSVKDAFFVQKQNEEKIYDLIYTRQELYVDNGYSKQLKVVENKQYLDVLKELMKDNETLCLSLEKIKKPERTSLISIIDLYNSKAGKQTNKISTNPSILTEDKLILLRKGKINLYLNPNNENSFYIKKSGSPLSEITYITTPDYDYNDLLIHSYSKISNHHLDTLFKYMYDARLLYPTINSIKIPRKKNLEKLVDEYNSYGDDSTYIRKNTIKRWPLNIDIIPGVYFPDSKNGDYKAGLLLNIGFTNSNKNLFLKTGFFTYQSINEDIIRYYQVGGHGLPDPERAYKIPLQAECRINTKYVQPFVAVGYNIYLINGLSERNQYYFPTIAPGVNFNFGQRFALHFNLDWEIRKNKGTELFPEYFDSLYFFSGIKINL